MYAGVVRGIRPTVETKGAHWAPGRIGRKFVCDSSEASCDVGGCAEQAQVETVMRDRNRRILAESLRCEAHNWDNIPPGTSNIEITWSLEVMRRSG